MKVPLLISKQKAHKVNDDYILHFSISFQNTTAITTAHENTSNNKNKIWN